VTGAFLEDQREQAPDWCGQALGPEPSATSKMTIENLDEGLVGSKAGEGKVFTPKLA